MGVGVGWGWRSVGMGVGSRCNVVYVGHGLLPAHVSQIDFDHLWRQRTLRGGHAVVVSRGVWGEVSRRLEPAGARWSPLEPRCAVV